jgi:hypothetical protein
MGDWTSDLFFEPDVAMIKRSNIQSGLDNVDTQRRDSSDNIKSTES